MRLSPLVLAALPAAVHAVNIVLSNDDGWAEINIRQLYSALTSAGNDVVLSAPAENESGTGSSDAAAKLLTKACEFNSCPKGSPAEGSDKNNSHLNYVNSYPVTSMRYGIQTPAPKFFGGPPDIAVAGFNVGANLGATVQVSGTVGAATEAAKEGIPAIAFSGSTGSQTGYTAPVETYETVYADLSTNVTQTLAASATPYLPSNIWLNVNFGAVSDTTCSSPNDFSFVLSRILADSKGSDAVTCDNGGTLPDETTVVNTDGCWASISVAVANTKATVDSAAQKTVLGKLQSILSCLPS